MHRTNIYISADWDGDREAAEQLRKWNRENSWGLSLTDACDLLEESDGDLSCIIKNALSEKIDTSHTFILIVGDSTKSIRTGDCKYCNNNNSFTYSCGHGNFVNYHSFIEYECEKAVNDNLKIIVLYNHTEADRSKCPDVVKNTGTHIAMRRCEEGSVFWDPQAVRQAIG